MIFLNFAGCTVDWSVERLAAGTACSALHFACARHYDDDDGGDDDDDDGDGGDDDYEQEVGQFADRMHITWHLASDY